MSTVTFKTTILKAGDKNATGIRVPDEIIEALGVGKKPPVAVTINGYTYRTTVAVMGGAYMLSLSAEHRGAANVQGGDEIEVTLALDTAPRVVEVPGDLAAALAEAGARAAFDALNTSTRKEYARQVNDAKAAETRARRIAGIVAKVKG